MQIEYSKTAMKNLHISRNSLNDVPEVEPTKDEMQIIAAYESGDENYKPYISHEMLKQKLNL